MAKRSRSTSIDPPSECRSRSSSPDCISSTPAPSKIHLPNTPSDPPVEEAMRCSLPPHRETLSFPSYEDYEVHYRQAHVNRCTECGRNFPTDLFLNLHIEENHDSIVAARRARGEKTYGCFVENCERKCSTPQKRRMHLIDKHMFPKTYNFYIVNDGIDKQTSMLRSMQTHRRRLSSTPSSPKEGRLRHRQTSISHSIPASNSNPAASVPESRSDEIEIAELEKSMSALRFVPASVTNAQSRQTARRNNPRGALPQSDTTPGSHD
ncbi:hypothetical protein ASPSYDRAFT_84870 [Aspergillus sydowii CBS 593.65]|uniref:C2H2-type domain-containing protein n=1 Tax=Aspergillus sydowii CBS 593.65 TaxID=1036612 RepID=A0A1L9TZL5_9EURO|nr:uncharacterized protein ASPSYDRAFT_84870 [Aspergillus sydowii CBS 593.65]OJJ64884.1 hypothetical protein ASPSYDRAFT_84870 [Aspergillus sydowii CBS 593.65]